ncbi:MAG TPA: hypothetical protein DEA22_14380 [Blastocatellia bacterium]|nr:hypothetical protein [Blastocatellia bacterium]
MNLLSFSFMSARNIFAALIILIIGFAVGFFVANSINRGEVDELKRQVEQSKLASNSRNSEREAVLTEEEIRAKIAEADANPGDVRFQANLGIALYRYGSMKRDAALIREAGRLLVRANSLEENNFDVLAGLGSVNFDLAFIAGEPDKYRSSREFYQKALAIRPADSEILTTIGLTYYLSQPPDFETAKITCEKSLKINPNDERALEYIIRALVGLNRNEDAEAYFKQFRSLNPANPAISELRALLGSEIIENR